MELIEEKDPMGTLGYIFHHLRGWMGKEDIFVTNGDDIKEVDLKAMLAFHRSQGTPATLALMRMEKPDDYGAVLVREDRISDFLEKKPDLAAGLVSAGMYVISPAALAHIEQGLEKGRKFLQFEKDMFPALAKSKKLGGFVTEGTFYDCGTFERWGKAIREI
jgi:mannose-1-phosphate guanylyltransferase